MTDSSNTKALAYTKEPMLHEKERGANWRSPDVYFGEEIDEAELSRSYQELPALTQEGSSYFPKPINDGGGPESDNFEALAISLKSIDESNFTKYNKPPLNIGVVLIRLLGRFVKWRMSNFGDKAELREILNDLFQLVELVVGEVCPQHIQKIRHLSALVTDEAASQIANDPGELPPAPKPSAKLGRPADPDAAIARLSRAYLDSVAALSKLPLDDPRAIPIARRLVRSRERLGKRGFDTQKLGHDDYLRAARRVLNANAAAAKRPSGTLETKLVRGGVQRHGM